MLGCLACRASMSVLHPVTPRMSSPIPIKIRVFIPSPCFKVYALGAITGLKSRQKFRHFEWELIHEESASSPIKRSGFLFYGVQDVQGLPFNGFPWKGSKVATVQRSVRGPIVREHKKDIVRQLFTGLPVQSDIRTHEDFVGGVAMNLGVSDQVGWRM